MDSKIISKIFSKNIFSIDIRIDIKNILSIDISIENEHFWGKIIISVLEFSIEISIDISASNKCSKKIFNFFWSVVMSRSIMIKSLYIMSLLIIIRRFLRHALITFMFQKIYFLSQFHGGFKRLV